MSFEPVPNDSAFSRLIAKEDTTKIKTKNLISNYKKVDSLSHKQQTFLMETVTERRFRFPNDNFERVILNRVSGFPNSGIVALTNMIQPFSFYGDFLHIIDKNYVNPISVNSPALYFFNIEDTLYRSQDTIFIVSFHPRKGTVFEGLTGLFHINSKHWAVQNVQAKPSNSNQSTIKIEQQYQFDTTAAQWFPEQLNFEWTFLKYPSAYMGMRVLGRTYISNLVVNSPLQTRDFSPETPLIIEPYAYGQPDSAWLPYRTKTPLSMRDLRTYEVMDSISKKKNFLMWTNVFEIIASGKLPIKKSGVNLDLTRLIRTNNYENVRLGIGLTTAQVRALSRPKRLEIGSYVGYGLQDSAWKYGGYLKLRLAQSTQTTCQLNVSNDLREPGAISELAATGLVADISFCVSKYLA